MSICWDVFFGKRFQQKRLSYSGKRRTKGVRDEQGDVLHRVDPGDRFDRRGDSPRTGGRPHVLLDRGARVHPDGAARFRGQVPRAEQIGVVGKQRSPDYLGGRRGCNLTG